MENLSYLIGTTTREKFVALTGVTCVDPEEYISYANNKEEAVKWLLWHVPGGAEVADTPEFIELKSSLENLSENSGAVLSTSNNEMLSDSNNKVIVSKVEVDA